jgi:hypothetical protein
LFSPTEQPLSVKQVSGLSYKVWKNPTATCAAHFDHEHAGTEAGNSERADVSGVWIPACGFRVLPHVAPALAPQITRPQGPGPQM